LSPAHKFEELSKETQTMLVREFAVSTPNGWSNDICTLFQSNIGPDFKAAGIAIYMDEDEVEFDTIFSYKWVLNIYPELGLSQSLMDIFPEGNQIGCDGERIYVTRKGQPEYDWLFEKLTQILCDQHERLRKQLYNDLKEEYDYLVSNENKIKCLSRLTFDAEGTVTGGNHNE